MEALSRNISMSDLPTNFAWVPDTAVNNNSSSTIKSGFIESKQTAITSSNGIKPAGSAITTPEVHEVHELHELHKVHELHEVDMGIEKINEVNLLEVKKTNAPLTVNTEHSLTQLESIAAKAHLDGRLTHITTGTTEAFMEASLVAQLEGIRTMVVSNELKKLAVFIQQLQINFTGNNGSVSALVSPLILATEILNYETIADIDDYMLSKMRKPVEIIDSIACIDGLPIWERLEGEQADYYLLFKLYRDMKYTLTDDGDYFALNRSLAKLSRETDINGALINQLAKIYHWTARCNYFDNYIERQAYKKQCAKQQLLQADHFHIGTALAKKAFDFLNSTTKGLTPKEAIAMLDLGLQYSRLSLGLQPNKPDAPEAANNKPTFAIYNSTTNNTADNILNVNAGEMSSSDANKSAVERQLQSDIKQEDNLLTILHVLQKSGAMGIAINTNIEQQKDADYDEVILDEVLL